MSERVVAYIDGFNLYWGLRDKGWRKYYWLNLRKVCEKLLRPEQRLLVVKYFTSRVKNSPEKKSRQNAYLDALHTIPHFEIFYGKYQFSPSSPCKKCGCITSVPEEKMTDVLLATAMVSDAHKNKFDTALLISGDIDLVPSVEVVRSDFADKRVVAAFPPMRKTQELVNVVNAYVHITEQVLKNCELPEEVETVGGYVIKKPVEWG